MVIQILQKKPKSRTSARMELVVLREEGLEGVWEKKTVTYKPGFQFRWQQNSSTRQRRQALGGRARNKGQAC